MAKQDYSNHQKKIISRYYENLDTISLTKLQELVTELYLAETAAQADRLWQRVEKAMAKMKIAPERIGHIMTTRDVGVLAANLQDWLKKAK